MRTIKKLLFVLLLVFAGSGHGASSSGQSATDAATFAEDTLARLQKLAETGDAKAQNILGAMYAAGDGVPKNAVKAAEWYQKSASQGDARAQTTLGMMYATGDGVPKDAAKAADWLHKAAEQGDSTAQARLGVMYRTGDGIPKDKAEAREWLQKAAAQGNADALFNLGEMYRSGEGVPKNASKAAELFQEAAAQEDTRAQFKLGAMYATGVGVSKNAAKAAEWFQKAASHGDVDAQNDLGIRYATGDGVRKDAAKAIEWLQTAAERGDTKAQFNLGVMYATGEDIPKDSSKAAEWFLKAAAQGDPNAQFNLGVMYYMGEGVSKDCILAYAWLNLAAAQNARKASNTRNMIELNSDQRLEAERISSSWVNGQVLWREGASAAHSDTSVASNGSPATNSTGAAFLISMQGHAVTNNHIVAGCKEVRVQGRSESLQVIARDEANDLALLKLPGETRVAAVMTPATAGLRQGQEVVVFSFPLDSMLSSGDNLAPCTVSAVTDHSDNSNQIRITAPMQVGLSGSPLLDRKGNVVGMVSAKPAEPSRSKAGNILPKNANYAVSGQALKLFLDANKVPYKTGGWIFARDKSLVDLGDEARKWTTLVECWK
jgi:TPR repeat protein